MVGEGWGFRSRLGGPWQLPCGQSSKSKICGRRKSDKDSWGRGFRFSCWPAGSRCSANKQTHTTNKSPILRSGSEERSQNYSKRGKEKERTNTSGLTKSLMDRHSSSNNSSCEKTTNDRQGCQPKREIIKNQTRADSGLDLKNGSRKGSWEKKRGQNMGCACGRRKRMTAEETNGILGQREE